MGPIGASRSTEQLVEQYYVCLYRYAYRLSGSTPEAEDLTQETFCKAQLNLSQLRDPNKTKSWLFRILRNVYLQKVRRRKNQPLTSIDDMNKIPQKESEPTAEIDSERLQTALTELPEAFRTPLILYYFEEFSYRDIAEQMDLPIGTVMSRLARAKAALRSRLLLPAPEMLTAQWRTSSGL